MKTPARPALNAREKAILELAAKGLSDRAIASKLGLSAETIRWYSKRVYEKLDAANRTDAVSRATELGLLTPHSSAVVRHPIRYVDNDGVSIAYQVIGKGPVDLLFIPGFVSHIEMSWETPGPQGYRTLHGNRGLWRGPLTAALSYSGSLVR